VRGLVSGADLSARVAKEPFLPNAFMSYTAFLGRSDLTAEQRRMEDQIARAEADLT